jgi:hypothetical protein
MFESGTAGDVGSAAGFGVAGAPGIIASLCAAIARQQRVRQKNYELAAGYATGGAQVFAGIRWQPR